MAIERANILYPLNSTTVDSAAGIDIRLLSAAQAGATDSDQSVRFTHTQDGQERTFDPDNALVTVETDPLTFQGEGWALRLAEDMTPVDDTNCNATLNSGTATVNVRALLNMNGGTNTGGGYSNNVSCVLVALQRLVKHRHRHCDGFTEPDMGHERTRR